MKSTHFKRDPAGFTVIELMIVVAIMALLAAVGLSAFNAAVAQSKISRTKVIIAKLDQLIMERYESYRTRPVPIRVGANVTPLNAAGFRLRAMRDLMRMELPDRKSDVVDDPGIYDGMSGRLARPSLLLGYRRRANNACGASWATTGWTEGFQGAECLYLIVSSMRDQDKSALDFFTESEIGDTDDDGMKEFLDGWGRPIEFLRWAPGYTIENGALTMQTSDPATAPDPFDPLKRDTAAFALHPLIFSSGPDREPDIFTDNDPPGYHHYSMMNSTPNPYAAFSDGQLAGTRMDRDADGVIAHGDNITNHYQEAE